MASASVNDQGRSPPLEAIQASRNLFLTLAAFSFFVSLLMLTGPLYMLQVYDRVLASQSLPTLVALSLLVAGLYLTLALLDWSRQSLFSIVGSHIESRLAGPALERALDDAVGGGQGMRDRMLRDLRTLRRFVSSPALPALFDAPFTPLFFGVLFMLHWLYGVWALVGGAILLAVAVVNQIVSRAALEAAEAEERRAQAQASELLRQSDVVTALGMRETMRRRWSAAFDASDAAITQSGTFLGGFTATTKALRLLMQSGILGLGAYLSIIGVSTPGAMIAASILMGRAIAPIEQIVAQWRNIAGAREAWTGLREAFDGAAPATPGMVLPRIRGRVALEDVIVTPPGSDVPILKRVSLSIAPGEMVGVIGPSASGKSTLGRAILGLWPARTGAVRIDGAEVAAYPRDVLGRQVGYLPQRVDLFSGTVRDNIARFDPDARPEAVLAAAQSAGCHDLILRLPDGYDTEIGPSGASLSDGQRQRIGLARALYGDPALVVLDEPNANLDSEGDAALQAALKGLKARGATIVVIAHRPNTITHCDTLVVLEEGRVRLKGPRDEVLGQVSQPTRVAPLRRQERGHHG